MDYNTITSTFLDMITPEMLLVIAAVYGICFALKKAAFFNDRLIPLAAIVIGILLELISSSVISRLVIADCVIRGILCGMAAVYTANIIKQAKGSSEANSVK